ncbi:MAG TPA: putative DNA-binding domain-containing protein [Woeseiaceae bacterium]
MAEVPDFQRKQYAFAAHIRDPDIYPAPAGVEDRRMAIYRELFFNNLLKLISGTFPVLKKLHPADKWRRIVREFMVRHRAQSPYFLQVPREFLEFLENEYVTADDDFPFLLELAHYEWAELALTVSADSNDLSEVDSGGNLLDGMPVQSTLAWPFTYQYPVHRIGPDFMPTEPGAQPTVLVVYRQANDEVGFMELNPVTAQLLAKIGSNDEYLTGRQLLLQLAEEIHYPDTDAFLEHGLRAMEEMRRVEILLGVVPSPRNP